MKIPWFGDLWGDQAIQLSNAYKANKHRIEFFAVSPRFHKARHAPKMQVLNESENN